MVLSCGIMAALPIFTLMQGIYPVDQSRDEFAQALRSVGEPIFGRKASDISMARLLAQLFQVTDVFDMHLQPQLVLLQKTMVVVEGVARDLDANLNIWDISKPVIEEWMHNHLGPEARLRDLAEGAMALAPLAQKLPELVGHIDADQLALVDQEGLRLHPDTLRAMAKKKTNAMRPSYARYGLAHSP